MDHIDQGLSILDYLCASQNAARAFCIHPLFQGDADLLAQGMSYASGNGLDRETAALSRSVPIVLAMEFRHWANAYSLKEALLDENGCQICTARPAFGALPQVKHMLIADKVHERKEFERHHKGRHVNSLSLGHYYSLWFDCLGVSEYQYEVLCHVMEPRR
jgi:hypothetical protein